MNELGSYCLLERYVLKVPTLKHANCLDVDFICPISMIANDNTWNVTHRNI